MKVNRKRLEKEKAYKELSRLLDDLGIEPLPLKRDPGAPIKNKGK